VVDGGNRRVQKFKSNGDFILSWPVGLPFDGTPRSPMGIAIDKNSDFVYVTDDIKARLQKFTSGGALLGAWDSSLFGGCPIGVDVDKNGNIYLATNGSPAIQKFDKNMTYIGGIGINSGNPNDPYSFYYPEDIAVNKNGDIYVTVWGDSWAQYPSQVKKFNSAFVLQTTWYQDRILAITIDLQQNVLVATRDSFPIGVIKYDPNGIPIQSQSIVPVDDCGSSEKVSGAQGMDMDSKGNLYIHDWRDLVQKFAPPLRYYFEGFFSPIENNQIVNNAKAGQTIPVKWRITDMNGLPVSDPASFVSITSYQVSCTTFAGDPSDDIGEYASGSSGLQYLGNGCWQFNWKTSKIYAGYCRIMKLILNDNQVYTASFTFK